MEKKMVYICAQRLVPHGSAGGNRILANAKAIQNAGIPVTVIGHGETDQLVECVFEGVRHFQIPKIRGNKLKRAWFHLVGDAKKVIHLIEKDGYEDKFVILYEPYYGFGKRMVKFLKNRLIPFCSDIVEWHQPFQFKYGQFNIMYRMFVKSFNRVVPASGKVVAISTLLGEYFNDRGCETIIVPPLVDCLTISPSEYIGDVKIRLIYAGTYKGKDNMDVMIRAISQLSITERERIEFHITTNTPDVIREICDKYDVESSVVITHERMSYPELMTLYSQMDFLFLIRENTIVNRANFPSKVPEMMACGISVLGNRVGDYHCFLTDGKDSILLENDELDGVVFALKRVLAMNREEILQMKRNSRKTTEEKFDFHAYSDTFKEFLDNGINV